MEKNVLVTGASRGIGAAIFDLMVQEGYRVAGTATSTKGADAISARGGLGLVCDITKGQDRDALLAELKAQDRTPDILVNNAGVTADNLLMRMSDEEFDRVIDTNLKGVFALTKAVVRPMMKQRWGRIISIGSVVARLGNPGQANYCASKAAVEGFTRSIARELGSRNITANIVAPGFIATDMTDTLGEEVKDKLMAQIPLARLGVPDDIAHMVAFLASDKASYVTGQVMAVNGGMLMP